ncbi:tetratricopeptide repeat protein [Coleofasciculus chthonoplastes]|uniref:tetratricopeptide repeat protein n=1 Tax=Coleofasciculus chthonoplastes TaxID=64178 RepID=UPI0032FC289E
MTSDKHQQDEMMVLSGNSKVSENPSTGIKDVQSDAHTFLSQGIAWFQQGDYRRAIAAFNQALQINPDLVQAYHYRGMSHYCQGDALGAIGDFDQVLRLDPQNAQAYSDRGLILATLNDRWGAMQDYNQALQLDPNYAKGYLNRSMLRLALEDYDGAIADCDQVIRMNPNLAEGYLNRGIARFELEAYQDAIVDCDRALAINPNLAAAYFNRGMNHIALGAYQEAIADFNHVLELNPNDAQASLNRGYVRLQLGENWGSIEDFDQAMRLEPVAAKAFFQQIANTLNQETDAVEDDESKLIQGLMVQGHLRYQLGDYQAALNAYNQVLNLDPNYTEAYNQRSTVRSAMGDYQGAIADLETVKTLSLTTPFSPEPVSVATDEPTPQEYHKIGVHKLNQEDFHGAIEAFNYVLQHNQNNATVLTCRGFAYRRLGDKLRAIEDFQKAAKVFYEQGDMKSSQEVIKTLKKLRQ